MKRLFGIILGVLVIFSIVIAGCTSKSTSSTAANAPATIKIGAMLSITGADSSTGLPTQWTFQYAIDEINKAGGVSVKAYNKKIALALDLKDNETNPEKVMAAAQQLNADGCPVVIGTTLAGISANIFEQNKLPLLVSQCDVVALTTQGFKYYFDTSKLNSGTATAIFQMIASLPKAQVPTKWAFFEEQADWITELVQMMKQEAAKQGINFAYEGQYQMLTPDFSQLIIGAKSAGAEVLVGAPTPPDGINILKQMKQLNYSPKAIIFFRAASDPSWADLGALGNYVIQSSEWDPNISPNDTKIQTLITAYKNKFGPKSNISGVGPAYTLIQIITAAIEKAGSLDRTAIRDAIAATNLDTMEGHITFNANGVRVDPPMVVEQWQNGVQNMVWPFKSGYNTKQVIWPIP